jgi:hypothetical protein
MDSNIASKEQLLKVKLIDFYKIESNLNILLPIILQQTRLSLRSLDWFVTNYSKKYNTNYIETFKTEDSSFHNVYSKIKS